MAINPFVWLTLTVVNLVWWAIFIWFAMQLLIQFNVINRFNPWVNRIYSVLDKLIEPLLRPIRRYIPTFNGFDFSPLVLILGLQFLSKAVLFYGQ
jgi:YggT family protein